MSYRTAEFQIDYTIETWPKHLDAWLDSWWDAGWKFVQALQFSPTTLYAIFTDNDLDSDGDRTVRPVILQVTPPMLEAAVERLEEQRAVASSI